jgi:hypothetical protein
MEIIDEDSMKVYLDFNRYDCSMRQNNEVER